MTKRLVPAVVVLFAVGSILDTARAEDPAPDGCHWQPIPELKAHLAVPDGWLFEKVSTGDILVYQVKPAGQGYEGLRSVYRLEVRLNTNKADVVERAREFVESLRTGAIEAQPLEEQEVGVLKLYSSFSHHAPRTEGSTAMSVAASSVANTRTGTLYLVRFDIPSNEVEVVAPLGNHLFRSGRLDDEL